MNKRLTTDFNFVKRFDESSAEVYLDKKYYYLTNQEIARYRNMTEVEVKELYVKAKGLLKEKDKAWLIGLSSRAKAALIANRYTEFSEVYDDIMNEKIDLECFKGIGHKVAVEIRRWCINQV